jgi:hypothetical protein
MSFSQCLPKTNYSFRTCLSIICKSPDSICKNRKNVFECFPLHTEVHNYILIDLSFASSFWYSLQVIHFTLNLISVKTLMFRHVFLVQGNSELQMGPTAEIEVSLGPKFRFVLLLTVHLYCTAASLECGFMIIAL